MLHKQICLLKANWAVAAPWVTALACSSGGAGAVPTCQGTYAATVLQRLPAQIVVDLDVRDRSSRNLAGPSSRIALVTRSSPRHVTM